MAEKKNILTYEGLKALEDELQDLKLNRRKEVAAKIKEAREQGDLSEMQGAGGAHAGENTFCVHSRLVETKN
jgi:transcription elongation GreA/GreB family factor